MFSFEYAYFLFVILKLLVLNLFYCVVFLSIWITQYEVVGRFKTATDVTPRHILSMKHLSFSGDFATCLVISLAALNLDLSLLCYLARKV